jgi:hypothetical protein
MFYQRLEIEKMARPKVNTPAPETEKAPEGAAPVAPQVANPETQGSTDPVVATESAPKAKKVSADSVRVKLLHDMTLSGMDLKTGTVIDADKHSAAHWEKIGYAQVVPSDA